MAPGVMGVSGWIVLLAGLSVPVTSRKIPEASKKLLTPGAGVESPSLERMWHLESWVSGWGMC